MIRAYFMLELSKKEHLHYTHTFIHSCKNKKQKYQHNFPILAETKGFHPAQLAHNI
jgi:hypothetical protein